MIVRKSGIRLLVESSRPAISNPRQKCLVIVATAIFNKLPPADAKLGPRPNQLITYQRLGNMRNETRIPRSGQVGEVLTSMTTFMIFHWVRMALWNRQSRFLIDCDRGFRGNGSGEPGPPGPGICLRRPVTVTSHPSLAATRCAKSE